MSKFVGTWGELRCDLCRRDVADLAADAGVESRPLFLMVTSPAGRRVQRHICGQCMAAIEEVLREEASAAG